MQRAKGNEVTVATETSAEQTPQAAPEAPAERSEEQILADLDEFARGSVAHLKQWTEEHNTIVGTLNALGGDSQALLESLRENPPSDNTEVQAVIQQIQEANEILFTLESRRDSLLQPYVDKVREDSAGQREKLEKDLKVKNDAIKAARAYLRKLPDAPADVEKLFPSLTQSKGSRQVGVSGIRRIRSRSVTVTGTDGTNTLYDSFGEAAKGMEADTAQLQAAFFNAAGTDDQSKWADEVSFKYGDATVVVRKKDE